MGKYVLIILISIQSVYAFWPFNWFKSPDPLPPYAIEHPLMTETKVYGVGNGNSFLEAKTKALNDIATQLQSNVRSITSVSKNNQSDTTQVDQQITVLTKRQISNYTIIDESHANSVTYLLIEYTITRDDPSGS